MADKNKPDSTASRAGRWLARLLGRDNVQKLQDSVRALKSEYEAGKHETEEPPPRSVPHRVVDAEPTEPTSEPHSSDSG